MAKRNKAPEPFTVRDCALAAIATGVRAFNLRELRENLMDIHPGSIYYHFWGGLLRPRFDMREYNNDFAVWVKDAHGLHDETLAERLGVVDPRDFSDLEGLRTELLEVIEERLDESERLVLAHADEPFQFIRSQIVVFDTHRTIEDPAELATVMPHMSSSSVFYHFVDARHRLEEGVDDFRAWLAGFGNDYALLMDMLAGVDPYFSSLTELRQQLTVVFQEYFGVAGR